MKYGTFRYGEFEYGPYELSAEQGAIGQDIRYRLSPLGNLGVKIGSSLLNQSVTLDREVHSIRIQTGNRSPIISSNLSLDIEPTRFRIKTNLSDSYLVSVVGTLRKK